MNNLIKDYSLIANERSKSEHTINLNPQEIGISGE